MTKVLESQPYWTEEARASLARDLAASLIDGETKTQNMMWGADAARTDCANGELALAAQSSILLTILKDSPGYTDADESRAVTTAQNAFYPENWSGFRDYGNVYNLVVAAAFLRNEIARRIFKGEDYDRKPRKAEQVYTNDQPKVSSDEAQKQL